MKKVLKKVTLYTIAFISCAIVFVVVGVYAATTLSSSSVYYDNSKSGGTSTTVSGAIDELYEMAEMNKSSKIISAYTYDQEESSTDYCVIGVEGSCKETKCYETTATGSCPAGTIINYMVNDDKMVTFHVMYDNGETMSMQSQKNIVYNIKWYENSNTNTAGPLTILSNLENETSEWTNVNDQTYTMGTTIFKSNAYTGCSAYNSCRKNTYTLAERSAKARLITVQEATNLGCNSNDNSCPLWMTNFLNGSTEYGGVINDPVYSEKTENVGYWTMNAYSSDASRAWYIDIGRCVKDIKITNSIYGARAVVEINK